MPAYRTWGSKGGECVNHESLGPFRKASYSELSGACIEVASDAIDGSCVRDSKDKGGHFLRFTADAWGDSIARGKGGDLGG